jgi:lectin-like protein
LSFGRPTVRNRFCIAAAIAAASIGCGRIGYEEDGIETNDSVAGSGGANTSDAAYYIGADTGSVEGSSDAVAEVDPADAPMDAVVDVCVGDACVPCVDTATCTCETNGNHAYRFCNANATGPTWAQAEADCELNQMRLVRVDDKQENDWLRSTGNSVLGLVEFWIGAEDPTSSSNWQWSDGAVFWIGGAPPSGAAANGLFSNWVANGQRPTASKTRTCAGLVNGTSFGNAMYDGQWADRSCASWQPYVCERY